jgi:hypothetical protein
MATATVELVAAARRGHPDHRSGSQGVPLHRRQSRRQGERYAKPLEFTASGSDTTLRGNYFCHEIDHEPFALLHRQSLATLEAK